MNQTATAELAYRLHGHVPDREALIYFASKSPDLPPMPDGKQRRHAELASIPLEKLLQLHHYPDGGLFDDEQLRILDTDAFISLQLQDLWGNRDKRFKRDLALSAFRQFPPPYRSNRNTKWLSCYPVDLDCAELNEPISPLQAVAQLMEDAPIYPGILHYSGGFGRGVWALWPILDDQRRAIRCNKNSRADYQAFTEQLVERYAGLGADKHCTDPSRAIRPPGTRNSKNGQRAFTVYPAGPNGKICERTTVQALFDAFEFKRPKPSIRVVEVARPDWKPAPKDPEKSDDMRSLALRGVKGREREFYQIERDHYGGKFPISRRHKAMTVLGVILKHGEASYREERMRDVGKRAGLSEQRINEAIRGLKSLRAAGMKRSTILEWLGITPEDATALQLHYLMPPEPGRQAGMKPPDRRKLIVELMKHHGMKLDIELVNEYLAFEDFAPIKIRTLQADELNIREAGLWPSGIPVEGHRGRPVLKST